IVVLQDLSVVDFQTILTIVAFSDHDMMTEKLHVQVACGSMAVRPQRNTRRKYQHVGFSPDHVPAP
ncbi:hypothetical protein RA272_28835, partial [Pseudomonas syringae pv. tagetis]|uniref:hypothetical protein n=1 Tax=Pseudomonas syringae group genomosp. 7 TaxID=251699 RepID=UPI0037701C39